MVREHSKFGSGEDFIGFYHIWTWRPSWSCFVTVFPGKTHRRQILTCRKISQSQSRVIMYINFVKLEYPILHAKFQDHRTSSSREKHL